MLVIVALEGLQVAVGVLEVWCSGFRGLSSFFPILLCVAQLPLLLTCLLRETVGWKEDLARTSATTPVKLIHD